MEHHNKTSAMETFQTDPIAKIVIKNSIPALIAMIMVMVYNLADTFFLGLPLILHLSCLFTVPD